jgi:tRNA A37 threonylcarbamoyladenosine biosynthesis protein TsaE
VLLIEWPDRMAALLPADRLDIVFEGGDKGDVRSVKIIARGDWAVRVGDLSV